MRIDEDKILEKLQNIDYPSMNTYLLNCSEEQQRAFFSFTHNDSDDKILLKFDRFARITYPRFFHAESPGFHLSMAYGYLRSYKYNEPFINLAFRGSAKTTLMKLFMLFILLNDKDKHKKYIKFITKDIKNSKQFVTDVYNMMVEVKPMYGDVFIRSKDVKHEESMHTFTLADGRKISAGTVGTTQRGHIQDAYRPDWLIMDDIEDKESMSSLLITQGIIEKCDEAITGLAKEGTYTVLGNYISAQGSIQWFINMPDSDTLITPILTEKGTPTWDAYTLDEIEKMKNTTLDFYGEYMCDPNMSESRYFDLERIDLDMESAKYPFRSHLEVKYWANYDKHHRYGIGADIGEGSGKDSSTMAVIDFTEGKLVATYHSNRIQPLQFAKELMRVGNEFGGCIIAPERNNNGVAVLENMREYRHLYMESTIVSRSTRKTDKMGWHTNKKSKPFMFDEFRMAYHNGEIEIKNIEVLREMKAYAFDDMNDSAKSLVTRHFDLLTAVVIAWQMRKQAMASHTDYVFKEEAALYGDIGC